jgi:8-amino-7-oxononanoate synthase
VTPGGHPQGWTQRMAGECAALAAAGRWRRPRSFAGDGIRGTLEGRPVVAFAGNDYLGLATHPAVVAAAVAEAQRTGTGAGASRLVTGSRPVHADLEAALASWKHTERAVLFPSGYAANLGLLTTLGGPDVLICSDEQNHASIVDGARLARAKVAVYPHGDLEHLDALLAAAPGPALVVTDLVFSMDGDRAPVGALADCCRRHGALLVLDEAHAVLGPDLGAELDGVEVARVGTLSKTLGSVGGFVAGSRTLVELLENRARSYIFTTALPPTAAAAALAALGVWLSPEGSARVDRLRAHVDRLLAALPPPYRPPGAEAGWPSPIRPLVLGSEDRALAASETLLDAGLWVPAIRPPSVPPGTSRLRVTLSAAHHPDEVATLGRALARLLAAAPGPDPVRLPERSELPGPEDPGLTRRAPRPTRLVAVIGTGTEVGKTWVTAALARSLRSRDIPVAARKLAQSFEPGDPTTDAAELARATGEIPEEVCPRSRWYPVPMAPPMAADALRAAPFTLTDLLAELAWPPGTEVGLLESAGGLGSPQATDGDAADLLRLVRPDHVLLVADAGLGTLHAVRATLALLDATQGARTGPVTVVLNRYDRTDPLHRANREWLATRGLAPVVVAPGEVDAPDALLGVLTGVVALSPSRP